MLDLTGPWTLRDALGEYDVAMTLPGDGITALQNAGQIADPYFGKNEYTTRWIADRDWTVTRQFTLTDTQVELVISQLDTVAEIRVNGVDVLSARNSFRIFRVDLSDAAQIGENTIEITFRSNPKAAAKAQTEQPFAIPYQVENSQIPSINMLRKTQCDFGWDWNIALAPFGLYGTIAVETKLPQRIDAIVVSQEHSDDTAIVSVDVTVSGYAQGEFVHLSLCGQELQVVVENGGASAVFTLNAPQLWWPVGLGDQVLHDLVVQLGAQSETRRIGLRQIDLVVEKDDIGTGFKIRVNGADVFCRGANWIPADALPGRITQEGVRDLLQSAKDAHMNMIRVWGGGRYEADYFYDMCDEMGLLVWQDFMFACHQYPSTDTFLAEVRAEATDQVRRLNHHASLAVWCGDNELIGSLKWFEETRNNRDLYLVNYDRLNRCIEQSLKDVAPKSNWWPSSPSPGYMSFGDAWHDDSSGDMHFWSVWHEGRDFEHYLDIKPRFCSEFGFQSYPSIDIIRDFADPADFNIASPVLESHQKNGGGNARIAETMFRYFRFPVGFENFVYLSQVQQALAIKTAVSHWRGLKPHCMGTLIWQLNDTWPVASWSSLDYGGGWKLLHHAARRFYAPVAVNIVPSDSHFTLRGVNDAVGAIELTLDVSQISPAGVETHIAQTTVKVVPDSAIDLLELPRDAVQAGNILVYRWHDTAGGMGEDHYTPTVYKHLALVPAGLDMTVMRDGADWVLALTSTALALFVSVEVSVPGRLTDNCIIVAPDTPKTLRFTPKDAGAEPEFVLRDLYSATYGASE